VPVQTFSGQSSSQAIFNKGNDTAAGTYSNQYGSGPISLETNLLITPTSETLDLNKTYNTNGFGPTGTSYASVLFVTQTLQDTSPYDPADPNGNKFTGRQVYEIADPAKQSTDHDDCYTMAKAHGYTNPGGPLLILGSVWNVGGLFTDIPNAYGSDQIGWQTPLIANYRLALAGLLPCTATASQAMLVVNNLSGYSNDQFATHTLTVTLYPTSVVVSKDGLTSTYPH
jgi:hypothetical protein